MTDDDYKTLLKQAEDELGATPGAYCSRKVALRAMELLHAAGQVRFSEFFTKVDVEVTKAQEHKKQLEQTIERQAQAIKRLEEEKTKSIRLGSSIPQYTAGIDPIGENPKVELFRRSAYPDKKWPRRNLDPYFDNAKQL